MVNIFRSAFVITILLFPVKVLSQAAMDFINYPGSVSSMGMGQQAVALPKYEGAMTYNPANLVFVDKPVFSFYHRQFAVIGLQTPLDKYSGYFNIDKVGAFGIEYSNRSYGEFIRSIADDSNPNGYTESYYYPYERSMSIGFAHLFSNELSAGINLTYARTNISGSPTEHILISGGLNYFPEYFSKKVSIGLSLTNFSNTIEFKYNYTEPLENNSPASPPAKLNLGVYYSPLSNDYFSTSAQLAISKYIVENDSKTGQGKSSFKSLFSDWNDFPKDVSVHTGLAFEWKPLNLGNGFSIFQNYYIGEESDGIKEYGGGYFTHGAELGLSYKDYSISAAYSGIWHFAQDISLINDFFSFPRESFQFKFSLNTPFLKKTDQEKNVNGSALKNIIVSFGAGQSFRVGRYNATLMNTYSNKQKNSINYNLEASFYLNERNSLVTSLNYSSVPWVISYGNFKMIDTKIEAFIFTSQYRYHPLESFSPFYFQGGLGMLRFNPVIKTTPRYDYKSTLHLSIGAVLPYFSPVIIDPEAAYTLMFNTAGNSAPRLGGYNQFDLRIKVGYKF